MVVRLISNKCNTWNGSAWTNVEQLNLGKTDFKDQAHQLQR